MANYVKATNFTAKDGLPTGNSGKIVKGAELDTEYTAVANAIASKADINSPTLTGTPAVPTASAGSNTTQIASTAFVTGALTTSLTAVATLTNKTINLTSNTLTGTLAQFNTACSNADFVSIAGTETLTNKTLTSPTISAANLTGIPVAPTAAALTNTTQVATTAFVTAAVQSLYPVGSIYVNATSATNPATLLGFGTWAAFGAGRVMVGLNSSDTLFDTAEETGGSKDSIVVAHTHTFSATTVSAGAHQHFIANNVEAGNEGSLSASNYMARRGSFGSDYNYDPASTGSAANIGLTSSAGAHTHTLSGTTASTGSSGTNANLPPYIVVRMWKRTA